MRISKKSEYALRGLVAFARAPKSWQIHELSAQENIPVKFLEQILLALRRAGFLTSKRGVGGGYSLRVPASRITVGEVIALMDGAIAPVPCAANPPIESCTCPDPKTCAVRLFMTKIREQLDATLGQRTIDDLVRESASSAAVGYEI